MAHGYQVARALARHNAGHARAGEHVALLGAVFQHHGLRFGVHEDAALRQCEALRYRLFAHVHHPNVAVLVHMRELVAIGIALPGLAVRGGAGGGVNLGRRDIGTGRGGAEVGGRGGGTDLDSSAGGRGAGVGGRPVDRAADRGAGACRIVVGPNGRSAAVGRRPGAPPSTRVNSGGSPTTAVGYFS